jgi:hypothetical protein
MTKMTTRLQRVEEVVLQRWLRSLSDAELERYVTDEMKAKLALLPMLSNEQLLRLYNGEPLSVVRSQCKGAP